MIDFIDQALAANWNNSWAEFWHMGGYAVFVWTSFLVALLLMGWVLLQPLIMRRYVERTLRQHYQRQVRLDQHRVNQRRHSAQQNLTQNQE